MFSNTLSILPSHVITGKRKQHRIDNASCNEYTDLQSYSRMQIKQDMSACLTNLYLIVSSGCDSVPQCWSDRRFSQNSLGTLEKSRSRQAIGRIRIVAHQRQSTSCQKMQPVMTFWSEIFEINRKVEKEGEE